MNGYMCVVTFLLVECMAVCARGDAGNEESKYVVVLL